jgi:hypothetical protein
MTIYGLYTQNSNSAGFWIQHRTWQNMCAQVMSIAEQRTGALPRAVPDQKPAEVKMRFFDVRSGRPVPVAGSIESPEDRGYITIAAPPWARRAVSQSAIL